MSETPFLSRTEPLLDKLLLTRAGNNKPLISNKSPFDSSSGVSGLSAWVRLVSAAIPFGQTKGGLVMDSIDPFSNFGKRYGNFTRPGIIGYELDLKTPVEIDGEGRGLRPSPIIESLTVEDSKYKKIEFSIKCFTLEQLDKVAEYFLEPGFHVLVEWGWNTNLSRREIVGGGGAIDPCDIAQYDKWPYLLGKKQGSDFTYDAGLGTIVNGGVKFNDDETYTLDCELASIGHVAEYMQTHRGGTQVNSKDSKSGVVFSPSSIEQYQEKGWIGKSLFMQMVNELPSFKQTPQVQQLIAYPKWTDKANFINMDSMVREVLLDSLNSAGKIRTSQGDIKLPKDAPLFAEERFIRFELAVEILNQYDFSLEPQQQGLCPKKKTRDLRIDISDTVISGFPHMFSTDPSKLFIPNTKAPNFNLINALSNPDDPQALKTIIDFENLNDSKNLANTHPVSEREEGFSLKEEKNGTAQDYAMGTSRVVPYAFPCRYELTEEVKPIQKADPTFIPPNEKPYFWGWLKDLYVNFDFFVETISKPNLFIRDVLYELLNGMSYACNSLWYFDIVEIPDETEDGNMRLAVIDRNFTGILDTNFGDETEFTPTGLDSPFISFDFNTDIPAEQISSITQKKMNQNIEGNPESPVPSYVLLGNVFSKKEDKVGSILNFTTKSSSDESETRETSEPAEISEENKNVVFDFITERATLFPKIQDRNARLDAVNEWYDFFKGNDALLEDIIFVGTWKDPKALSHIYLIDKGRHDLIKGDYDKKDLKKQNVPLGLYKIDFEVHGVSGFKLGNRMRFKNLPKKFQKNVFYQVTEITHEISDMQWITKVKTESRTYGDSENEEE